jgi:hypothetical protein
VPNLSSYWNKTLKVFSVAIVLVLTIPSPQQLAQKCLTYLERDLEALQPSQFGNWGAQLVAHMFSFPETVRL